MLAAGVVGVALLRPASWTELLAAAGSLAALAYGLWRAGWIGSVHRIISVQWLADGRWLLTDRRENTFLAELSADTRLAGSVLWLSWRATDDTLRSRRHSMLLTAGDLAAGQLRALRVRLGIAALERVLPEASRR
ncbi:MAG TPA: hypothetical protein VJQ52_15555 [Steroidobacteraceae bacterium]|nr:hypothetical protein [Steroidobacteraceae bacterium]